MNSRKPTLIMPMTDRTRAVMGSGTPRLNTVTAPVHTASIRLHSSSEPSWAPQTAEMR